MDNKLSLFRVKRVFTILLAVVSTVFTLGVLVGQILDGFEPIGAIFGSASATMAVLCWLSASRDPAKAPGLYFRYAVLGGKIIGGFAFLAGYIGPIILTPSSNQGPLFGIFISGPIGFVFGVLVGVVYGLFRSNAKDT